MLRPVNKLVTTADHTTSAHCEHTIVITSASRFCRPRHENQTPGRLTPNLIFSCRHASPWSSRSKARSFHNQRQFGAVS